MSTISMQRVEEIVDSYGCQRSNLIAIMQDIQAEYKYLSEETLELIAEKLDISIAKVYSVATFYENFSLEPKGKYIIKVCDGTACHVRKSQPIYDALREYLPGSGIELREIPRLEKAQTPVSASAVRAHMDAGDAEALRAIVPETTYGYLKERGLL